MLSAKQPACRRYSKTSLKTARKYATVVVRTGTLQFCAWTKRWSSDKPSLPSKLNICQYFLCPTVCQEFLNFVSRPNIFDLVGHYLFTVVRLVRAPWSPMEENCIFLHSVWENFIFAKTLQKWVVLPLAVSRFRGEDQLPWLKFLLRMQWLIAAGDMEVPYSSVHSVFAHSYCFKSVVKI